MQKVDLERIIKIANISVSEAATLLYPNNLRPRRALYKAFSGEYLLNADQLALLAERIDVPVGMLFDTACWKMGVPAGGKNIIQFRTYDYFAELDTKTMTTTISINGLSFFSKVTHEHGVGIEQYLSDLTDLIIKYK